MSVGHERMMKEVHKFIEENAGDKSLEEINQMLNEYSLNQMLNEREALTEKTAKTSDDFLELAEEADSDAEALKFAKKALKLDPDNIDAEAMVASLGAGSIFDLLSRQQQVVKHAEEVLKKNGYMTEEYIGEFWGVLETRPYIRACEQLVEIYKELGMYGEGAKLCERIIELNKNDNMGMRSVLIHFYAQLEDEDRALKLLEKYSEHDETALIMGMAVLYFKLNNLAESEKYLKKLQRLNKDTRAFFKNFDIDDNYREFRECMERGGYSPLSKEELVVTVAENEYLYESTAAFIHWARQLMTKK